MLLISSEGEGCPSLHHLPDMPDEEKRNKYGEVLLNVEPTVHAGEYTSVSFTITVGKSELTSGAKIGIFWRWAYDWGDLQTEDPQKEGYLDISTNSQKVNLKGENLPTGGITPWTHMISVEVKSGKLFKGDKVRVECGLQGVGWRAPTFREKVFRFLLAIDVRGDDNWFRLPDPPSFEVAPADPASLVLIAPSDIGITNSASVTCKLEDKWGNPTKLSSLSNSVKVIKRTGPGEVKVERDKRTNSLTCAKVFKSSFSEPGVYTLEASHPKYGRCESNPIRVYGEEPEFKVFWGDLHSGQTKIGCGAGTLKEHFSYGRDLACLDFITHQANDHYVTKDEWGKVRKETSFFNEPSNYITFLGSEWSPPTEKGGDRNVIYRRDQPALNRSDRYFSETDPDSWPLIPTPPKLFKTFKNRDVLLNLHVGGRPTNLDYHCPSIERLIEIHSTHGTSEWFVKEALARGFRVGITAGTDGVMGRPGGDSPDGRRHKPLRNTSNGLTAIYANSLTRKSLWKALQNRRCYATTGERILLWVDVNGEPMGGEYRTSGEPVVNINLIGTTAIEQVDLLKGTECIKSWKIAQPLQAPARKEHYLRILWAGTKQKGTASLQRLQWNGQLSVEGGVIKNVELVNFQNPRDSVITNDNQTLSWCSSTAGNEAGLIIKIRGTNETSLSFASEPVEFTCILEEVMSKTKVVEGPGFNQKVSIGPAFNPRGPNSVELSYRDKEPLSAAVTPYWVRATQINRSKAWSSPVYIKEE